MSRVVLVEDHERLGGLITQALNRAGVEVDVFNRRELAAAAVQAGDYAVLLLDRGLPDGDGIELLRRLRRVGNPIPCLILTARDALRDRIDGLDSGADDYLPKPFALEELVARVRALMRRPQVLQKLEPIYEDLQVWPALGCLSCSTSRVALPKTELQIVLCLVIARGLTVRRAKLENAAWGFVGAVTPNALDVALHRLRKKILMLNSRLQIVNLRGQGYALRVPSLSE